MTQTYHKPPVCHTDDLAWICNKIDELPEDWREYAASKYAALYIHKISETKEETKKQNVARKSANDWLRRQVENYNNKMERLKSGA